jgi:hypothetical protein
VRNRVVGFIVVLAAFLGGAGAAGAATVSGSLSVTATTPTSVSFTVVGQRTCAADEQCDYYADLEDLDGAGDCPTTYPSDPYNIWNGQVDNTGPTTETGTVTPKNWTGRGAVGPQRLCLYIFADGTYYYVSGTTITRPDPPADGGGTTTTPGGSTNPPGGITLPGSGGAGGANGGRSPGAPVTGSSGTRTPATRVTVRTVALTKASTSARAALKKAYGKKFTQGRHYRATCRRVSRTHVRCAVSWQRGGTWKGTVDVTGAIKRGKQVLVTRVRVKRP